MTNLEIYYVSREEKCGLTKEVVRHFFDYKDGFLYWKNPVVPSKAKKGEIPGRINSYNRRTVNVKGKEFFASRIIFLWHHGYLPETVDHEDRDCSNDRIENLRPATLTQNNRNKTSVKNSSSKYLGVVHHLKRYWVASININKVKTYIGTFKTQELAALAYNKFAVIHYGEFANLNIIEPISQFPTK